MFGSTNALAPADATRLAMYRQWICAYDDMTGCQLTVEAPDYVAGKAIGTNLSIEGWGGAAAGSDEPASPYVAETLGAFMDIDRVGLLAARVPGLIS